MEITLDNLRIRQGDFSLSASFAVDSDVTAIIGPSGGGKSTLLMALAGFILPSSGRIVFGQSDMTKTAPANRPVSVLFQDNNLFPHLSVFKNVALGIRPNLRLTREERERIHFALDRVGMNGTNAKLPAELSGGQRQRVAIARTILRKKPILMLDEPFAALGPALRHEMLELVTHIREQSGGKVLLVTHNPDDAMRIAGETILVADNIAHAPLDTRTLLDNPPEALASYLGDTR